MAEVSTRTEWHDDPRRNHYRDYDVDEDDGYESVTSEEPYDSDDDGAPDLEVEASPFQHGSNNGDDVNASFFSDYEAGERPRAPAPASHIPSPPLPSPPLAASPPADAVKSDAHTLPHDEQGKADAFYDAEYASSMETQRRESSPASEAVVSWRPDKAVSDLAAHRNGRSNYWLDPLRSLSSPPVDEGSEDGAPMWLVQAPHGLSDSPRRGSDLSPPAPHCDTPLSNGGLPSVAVREGTAVPLHTRYSAPAVSVSERQSSARGPRACTDAPAEVADVVPSPDMTAKARAGTLATNTVGCAMLPPPVRQDSAPRPPASLTTDAEATEDASPPPRQPLSAAARGNVPAAAEAVVVRAQVPGLHPLSSGLVTNASGQQTRVVCGRAPRGVPLLLQYTGHIPTPTRTVAVAAVAEEDGVDDDDDETVNAGLHTSAYRETSGMSDLISSPSSLENAATSGTKKSRSDAARHTPDRAAGGGGGGGGHRRTVRSESPFVSLVDSHPAGDEDTTGRPQPTQSLSPSLRSSSSSAKEAASPPPPELVEFSVHTEALGCSAQEDSLVLCGFSVESLPTSHLYCGSARAAPHPPHPPQLPAVRRSANRPISASVLNTSCYAQQPEKARRAYSATLRSRLESKETEREVATQLRAPPAYEAGDEASTQVPWSSSELVHPAQVFNIHDAVESVEEAAVGDTSDHLYAAYAYPPQRHARQRGRETTYAPSALANGGCYDADDTFSVISTATMTALDDSPDELHLRRQQREAVCRLLARQVDPRGSAESRARHGALNKSTNGGAMSGGAASEARAISQPQCYSPAEYVAQQEQLRAQRMAAEAERLRLSLALDVCRAVRPYGRDLLLMFLLLVEEANATVRQHRQRSLACEGSCDTIIDSTQWNESRVSYETCAEAINCVLERHGVSWIRATCELCRRVVAWCRHHQQSSPSLFDPSLAPTAGDLVEYAAFVSCVMEFAAQYSDGMR